MKNKDNLLERDILENARQAFIENGFNGTSMSDIAARTGINRTVLHYYFHTKEIMFNAVLGDILSSFLPRVRDIVTDRDKSVSERIDSVISTYLDALAENPGIPLFIIREIHRDFHLLESALKDLGLDRHISFIRLALKREMDEGNINRVPVKIIFLTFYSLVTAPFLTEGLVRAIFMKENEDYDMLLKEWKPYVASHMKELLCPDNAHAN